MRQRVFLAVCMIAVLLLSLCQSQSSVAKKKAVSRLKGGLMVEKPYTKSRAIPLEKGNNFRLRDFLTLGRDNSNKRELRNRIRKHPKQKITLSGEGFAIKRQNFRPLYKGLYQLKVETEEASYVFPIYVVDKVYKLEADEIDKIWITIYRIYEGEFTASVESPEKIRQIVEKINQAEFTVNYEESQRVRIGNVGFTVNIQWKDGRMMELDTFNGGGFRIWNGWTLIGVYWAHSNLQAAMDCYDCLCQVFDEFVPAHRGERSSW